MKNLVVLIALLFITFSNQNLQAQWVQMNGPYDGDVSCLGFSGTNIFAGLESMSLNVSGVYLSSNNGTNWIHVNNGLPGYLFVYSIAIIDTNIFAGTEGGVYLSTNMGTNWTEVNNGMVVSYTYSLAVSGNNIFAGTFNGMYLSTNNGKNWTQENNGLTTANVTSLFVSGNNIIAGTYGGGVFLSKDNGTNWTPVGL